MGAAVGAPRTLDDEFADIARTVPGFGGMFLDADGRLAVRLKQPARLAEAKQELRKSLIGKSVGSVGLQERADQLVGSARSIAAQYDFLELYDWYHQDVLPKVGGRPGVLMTDIDERQNRIAIGVRDESLVSELNEALRGLSVPSAAVVVMVYQPVDAELPTGSTESCDPMTAIIPCDPVPPGGGGYYTLQDSIRPVNAAMQIGFLTTGICSLGYNAVVRSIGGQLQSPRYFLTASHCGNQAQMTGLAMGQPAASAVVANEIVDPGFFTNAQTSLCVVGRLCRYSDAALFQYQFPSHSNHARVAFPNLGSLTVSTLRSVSAAGDPVVGMTVHRIGRTSGRTTGTVTQTCVTLAITQNGIDTGRSLLCQSLASYASGPGDSGGPVVELLPDGTLVARGIHWRGSGGFTPINNVFAELNPFVGGGVGVTLSDGQ